MLSEQKRHSVDKLRDTIIVMLSRQKDDRVRQVLKSDYDMQRAAGEGRTLRISIQDADDPEYWVHIYLAFGDDGQIVVHNWIDEPTAVMWFNEETYNDIYERKITLYQAYYYSRIRFDGERWITHAQLLMRFFNKMWEVAGVGA